MSSGKPEKYRFADKDERIRAAGFEEVHDLSISWSKSFSADFLSC